jgi:autotransporter-associated beta strand protein
MLIPCTSFSRQGRFGIASGGRRFAGAFMVAVALAIATVAVDEARGAIVTWNSGNGTWSTDAAWVSGTAPVGVDTAVFSAVNAPAVIDLSGSTQITSLIFTNTQPTTLRASASGTQTLALNTGTITVNGTAGTVTIGNATNQVAVTLLGSQTWTNNSPSTFTILGPVTTSGSTFGVAGSGTTSFQGGLAGAGSRLNKAGAGTLVIGGTGGQLQFLVLNAGTVQLDQNLVLVNGGNQALSGTGGVINGPGQIVVSSGPSGNGQDWGTTNGLITVNAVVSGTGQIDTFGGGTIVFAGANTWSGGVRIFSTSSQIAVDSVGTVGSITSGAFGTGPIVFGGNTGAVSSNGTTPRTLLNAMNWAAGGAAANLGNATNSGKLTFAAGLDLSNGVRTVTTNSVVEFAGTVSSATPASGGLTKAGASTLILSGSNTYAGATTLNSGTLQIGNGGTTGRLNPSSAISGSAGATLAFDRSNSVTQGTDFASVISGSVNVTQLGSGTLVLNGANTYTGTTTAAAGTLEVNGAIGNGPVSVAAAAWLQGTGTIGGAVSVQGTLSPGNSPGVLTVGSVVLGGPSTTAIEINGVTRGTQYDGVNITGTSNSLTYGGALSLAFGNVSALPNGTTLDIFNFTGGFLGSYASVASTGFYSGTWSSLGSGTYQLVSGAQTLTFSPTTGDIIVVPEPAAVALAVMGLVAAGFVARRRRREAAADRV